MTANATREIESNIGYLINMFIVMEENKYSVTKRRSKDNDNNKKKSDYGLKNEQHVMEWNQQMQSLINCLP
jgi:adenylate kinase